jgi:hypothetical protein
MWFTFILLIIVAMSTFAPCCVDDNCEADLVSANTKKEQKQDKGSCSPFTNCRTCCGFVVTVRTFEVPQPLDVAPTFLQVELPLILSSYSSSFWQPPRVV